jgi:hypothetical protein
MDDPDIASKSVQELLSGLTFYRQKRVDGGIRTGVELDQTTILERFEIEEEEHDPALLWYVDVRCKGPGVPTDPESAEQWLLSTGEIIERGLAEFADHLRPAGADKNDYPLIWSEFPEVNDGVVRTIACSAVRRIESRQLAEILDDVRVHWSERIESMIIEQLSSVPRG